MGRRNYPRWNRSKTPSAYTRTGLPTGGGLVLKPTGCVSLPIGGGAIDCNFSSPASLELLFRPFRAIRSAISVLASVVSEGSSGTCTFSEPFEPLSCVDGRNLLAGGSLESRRLPFFWPKMPDSGAVDSPSSPDASRDEACNCSSVEGLTVDEGRVVRFRFPEPEPGDEGEDIVVLRSLNE